MSKSSAEVQTQGIFKQPETPGTTFKRESVDKTFRRAAVIGHCLGLFPCSSVIIKERPKQISPHYLLIPTFVSVILYISSVTGSILGLLLYLKEFKTVANFPLTPTDRFALKLFLSALLISRAISPFFCLQKAKSIAILVQTIARYDKTFQIQNPDGFVNLIFLMLLIGSVTNAVANTCVAWPVMYAAYKEDQLPTVFRMFGLKSPMIEFVHAFSGGFYGEIGMIFLSCTILYLGRVINTRIQEIEATLFQTNSVELPGSVAPAVKKMKALFSVKQSFESIFGTLMMTYVGFSVVILVTTFYCLTSFAVHFHTETVDLVWNNEFVSMLSVVLLTCFRLKAFVECGENMAKSGRSLCTRISFINPTKFEKEKELGYIQRVSESINFSFHANGYFIMNRRLILSILGAVVSFTVVLAQFRDADGHAKLQRNCTTSDVEFSPLAM